MKVLKALEAVVGHLRKFLVDGSVIPLFEKTVSLIFSKFVIKLKNSISLYTLYVKLQHYFGDVFKYHRRKCESQPFLISLYLFSTLRFAHLLFFCLSAMQQFPKTARQMPGLTNHHCIVLHNLALLLTFLRPQRGILSLLTVKVNWIHCFLPRQCHFMDKILLLFLVFVLRHLIVPVLPLLLQ